MISNKMLTQTMLLLLLSVAPGKGAQSRWNMYKASSRCKTLAKRNHRLISDEKTAKPIVPSKKAHPVVSPDKEDPWPQNHLPRYGNPPRAPDGWSQPDWFHPYRLKTNANVIPKGGPRYEHVSQNKIGNCWIMAMLGAIAAAQPMFIKHILRPHEETAGLWIVTFWMKGHLKREITVDEYFPQWKDDQEVYWPYLIEKAYAKFYKDPTYKKLEGGVGMEAGSMLTKMPMDFAYMRTPLGCKKHHDQKGHLTECKVGSKGTSCGHKLATPHCVCGSHWTYQRLWKLMFSTLQEHFNKGYPMTISHKHHALAIVKVGTRVENGKNVHYVNLFEPNNVEKYSVRDQIRPDWAKQIGKGLFQWRFDQLHHLCDRIYITHFAEWETQVLTMRPKKIRELQLKADHDSRVHIGMFRHDTRFLKGTAKRMPYIDWGMKVYRQKDDPMADSYPQFENGDKTGTKQNGGTLHPLFNYFCRDNLVLAKHREYRITPLIYGILRSDLNIIVYSQPGVKVEVKTTKRVRRCDGFMT